MPTYLILVERTIIDHYHIEADSAEEANQKFAELGDAEGPWEPVHSEGLEYEVREEETTEVT